MIDQFVHVTVTTTCACGTQWTCTTIRRTDMASLPTEPRFPACPLCTPPTSQKDDG